jgi:hypothetical protein
MKFIAQIVAGCLIGIALATGFLYGMMTIVDRIVE